MEKIINSEVNIDCQLYILIITVVVSVVVPIIRTVNFKLEYSWIIAI